MSYKKPILTEIFSEVYFQENSFPQEAFFEVIPLIQKTGYPKIEIGQVNQIQLVGNNDPNLNINRIAQNMIPRIRVWDDAKKHLIQLSPDFCAINQVGDYLGWDDFKSFFDKIFSIISKTIKSYYPISISLNTIDRFSVDDSAFVLNRYLACNGEIIPKWYADTKYDCDITLGKGNVNQHGSNRQIHIQVRQSGINNSISFQSIFHDKVEKPEQLQTKLEELHVISNETFERIITPDVRNKVMGGLCPQ